MGARWWVALSLFVVSLLVFDINFRYIRNADPIPNELLPISIIREHDLDLNEFYPDRASPPWYIVNLNGRYVSAYPIVPGLLNTPVYFVASLIGVDLHPNRYRLSMITSSLISAVSVALMYLVLSHVVAARTAVGFALIYAFATPVLSVTSRSLWQHGPSLLLLAAAFLLLYHRPPRLVPYAGFFLGMAIFNRPPNVVLVAPIVIYVFLVHRRAFVPFALFAAVPVVLMELYSYSYLGSLLALGQGQDINGADGGPGFSANPLVALPGLLISPGRGLFVFSPIFLFALVPLWRALRSIRVAPLVGALAVGVVLFVLLYSRWGAWWGGHSIGPRLLIETVPALIVLLAIFWESAIAPSWRLKAAFCCCLGLSLYAHFLAAFYAPCGYNDRPNNIDQHTERLWSVTDNELTRCSDRFAGDLARLVSGSSRGRQP